MIFFKRYNYIVLTAFFTILIIMIGLLYVQYQVNYGHKIIQLKNAFEERLLGLEYSIHTARDQVEAMKIKAQSYLAIHSEVPILPSPLFSQLQNVTEQSYNLDTIKPPFTDKIVSNITGTGSLKNRSGDFYREIEMVFDLNPLFQIATYNIPNSVWVYYTSANHFMGLYPWVSSKDFMFDEEFYHHEFYDLGLPKNNPKRKTFWTQAYIDEAGKGLMVTCAAPIYENEQFRGTVALDITLDILNKFVKIFEYPTENLFIINNNEQLLAHKELVNSKNTEITTAEVAFPATLRNQWKALLEQPEGEVLTIDNYLFIYKTLPHIPWKFIFWLPKRTIVQEALYSIGWSLGIFIPSLLIILSIINYVTRKTFVRPAELLVEHIENENKGVETSIPPVPKMWYKWFETVSHIFEENRCLFSKLKNHSASLTTLNQEKNEFLGIVAHDLKNPLSAILGFAELIQEADGDLTREELLEYARNIQVSSRNMFQLITNLLDVNIIESGKINLHLEYINISPILQSVIAAYAERAKRKNITVCVDNISIRHDAIADILLVQQILDNLISNAIKYSPQSKMVYIRVIDSKEQIRCEIQDEGQGLSTDEQQKLFTKFTRLSTKPTAGEHSTGLGLFIVKKLVTAMNGQVWCESEPGKGTTFITTLPKDVKVNA